MTALEELTVHLQYLHPNYTIHDVEPSDNRGYLKCTKPCPRWECSPEEHYHTIDISGQPALVRGKYGRGTYAFWRAVCHALKELKRREKYPLGLEHVQQYLVTKQDEDSIGMCYNAMYCLLSETLNWLYPEKMPWRVDVGSYSAPGIHSISTTETIEFLRRTFDSLKIIGGKDISKGDLEYHLQWMTGIKSNSMPFQVSDLFPEEKSARDE